MTIDLSPEQERRIQAVILRGSYESVDEGVEAALAAVEHRTLLGFHGTEEEMEAALADGLASKELTEGEFWESVNKRTDGMLADRRFDRNSEDFLPSGRQ
jgi:Arc/MetJ-type ribon-helix-helix transcriptional regulator